MAFVKKLLHGLVVMMGLTVVLLGQSLVMGAVVGFNYGTQMSAAPSARQVVRLVKAQHMSSIRLYDANGSILEALGGSGVEVSVGIPNTQLLSIGQSNVSAANWVRMNVLPFLPNTNITSIVVGEEVFTTLPNTALVLLPALQHLYSALLAHNLHHQVKLSTSFSTSLILDPFPPSQAFFNNSISSSLLVPLLSFLSQTASYVMLNVDTYSIYQGGMGVISLHYALFQPLPSGKEVVDSNTLLTYTNLFDAVLDSAFFAIARLNLSLPVVVSATGWPYGGDPTVDPAATVENAATYTSNLIAHIVTNVGTPKHPRMPIKTFVLELFSEDLKPGPVVNRHYGLFNSSTLMPTYLLHLSSSGQLLSNDTTTRLFCVASPAADEDTLQIALDWVCGIGQANCSAVQPGMLCYEPDTVSSHVSYAFDAYYQANSASSDSCNFGGAAILTTTNPSYGACLYPGAASVSNSSSLLRSNITLSSNITASSSSDGKRNSGDRLVCLQGHTWAFTQVLHFVISFWLARGFAM